VPAASVNEPVSCELPPKIRFPAPRSMRPSFSGVDVDQLAGPLAFVAPGGLQAQASESAHADPGQDPRDRRDRHVEQLGQLGSGKAQPPQRGDRLDATLVAAVGNDRLAEERSSSPTSPSTR
jgi:hypothetical protein